MLGINQHEMKDYGGQTRSERFDILDKVYARKLPVKRFEITKVA